jgi:AraC-like DNA-binding protein
MPRSSKLSQAVTGFTPREPEDWRAKPAFRVLTAGFTVDPPGAGYGPRRRPHYEFIWIVEGEARIRFDDIKLHAPEGAVLLRGAGVQDEYEWSPRRRTVHAFIHFDLDPPRRRRLTTEAPPPLRQPPVNDILRPLFGYLLALAQEPEPLRSRLMLPALDLLLEAYASGRFEQRPSPAASLQPEVAQAMELLQTALSREPDAQPSLEQLAAAVHCSPAKLCRLFKKDTGLAPLEYARLWRLDRAARQLRLSSLSLKEIALAHGFYDGNHFGKQFRQVYGLSPKEFRASELSEWLTQRNPIVRKLYPILDRALTRKA